MTYKKFKYLYVTSLLLVLDCLGKCLTQVSIWQQNSPAHFHNAELAELERLRKLEEENARRRAEDEVRQARLREEEEKQIRAEAEAERVKEEKRLKDIENDKKKKLAELREEILTEFITIEKSYLRKSKLQSTNRSLDITSDYNSRKRDLNMYRSKLIAENNDPMSEGFKKTIADLGENETYYSKAKKLVDLIVQISEQTEGDLQNFQTNRDRVKESKDLFGEMALLQEKIYQCLMETHISKHRVEIDFVKHQRLAGRQADYEPPINALKDLFNQKCKFIDKKEVSLKIELIDAVEHHEKEFVRAKIAICDEIRKIEEDKFKALCDRLNIIFEESQRDIARAVQELEEARRKSEEEAREREKHKQEEKERLERFEKERKERDDKDRREQEAKERVARAQEAALERRRLQGW